MARYGSRQRQVVGRQVLRRLTSAAGLGVLLALSLAPTMGCGDSPAAEVVGKVSGETTGLSVELASASAATLGVASLRLDAETDTIEASLVELAASGQNVLLRGPLEFDGMLVIEVLPLDRFDYIPGTIPSRPEE